MKAIGTATKLSSISLLATLALAVSACVDEEPSMELQGSVAYEGEFVETNRGLKPTCDRDSQEPGSVDEWYFAGDLDIGEVLEFGQVGERAGRFYVNFELINRLETSESIGSGGGGGGDDGFEGLEADQNTISATRAEVRFPSDLNTFDGADQLKELQKRERFSINLDSGGGAAIFQLTLFDSEELMQLRSILDDIREMHGMAPGEGITISAEITIRGETFSGTEVKSNAFEYPLHITDHITVNDPPPRALDTSSDDDEECHPVVTYSTPICQVEC